MTELSPPNIAKTALILGKTIATVDVTARKMAVHMTFLNCYEDSLTLFENIPLFRKISKILDSWMDYSSQARPQIKLL